LHLEAFVDDALASEGGVSVDDDRDDLLHFDVVKEELLGFGFTHYNGVHSFEMGGVGQHGGGEGFSIGVAFLVRSSQVVLDISGE
jgi:hypothetical protein